MYVIVEVELASTALAVFSFLHKVRNMLVK